MSHKGNTKSRSHASARDRYNFMINVKIEATGEIFLLNNISMSMKISELKNQMEFTTGIPINLQRLSYLDGGEILGHTDIRSNDIVPGGTIVLRVWLPYEELLEAVVANDEEWVFRLGVTPDSDYSTPNSEYMSKRAKKAWFEERAFIALCIAAHRGHSKLCAELIAGGADVNATTPLGRTALHVAAARGNGTIVADLLEKGADIDAVTTTGESAMEIAESFGHKSCERHLFLFRWQERAKKVKPSREVALLKHQCCDSTLPVWKQGEQCQVYCSYIIPEAEYEGTALHARLKHPSQGLQRRRILQQSRQEVEAELEESATILNASGDKTQVSKLDKSGLPPSYDSWLQSIKDKEKKEEEKRKKERDAKRQLEEEKRRVEEDKAGNYETWLAQKEAEKKKAPLSARDRPSSEGHERSQSMKERGPGALRLYLRSLGKDRAGQPYEDWLINKETEILGPYMSGSQLSTFQST